jgi:23S rRNA (cytidine2498-2'-O)-methyltransferase
MKKRWQETQRCLQVLTDHVQAPLMVRARQLYHDREEITVFATTLARGKH